MIQRGPSGKDKTFPTAPGQRTWHVSQGSSAESSGKELSMGCPRHRSNPRTGLSALGNS